MMENTTETTMVYWGYIYYKGPSKQAPGTFGRVQDVLVGGRSRSS